MFHKPIIRHAIKSTFSKLPRLQPSLSLSPPPTTSLHPPMRHHHTYCPHQSPHLTSHINQRPFSTTTTSPPPYRGPNPNDPKRSKFSFAKHNITMPDPKSIENQHHYDPSSSSKANSKLSLLSDELRQTGFNINAEDISTAASATKPAQKPIVYNIPLFLDATQPFETAMTVGGSFKKNFIAFSLMASVMTGYFGLLLYNTWKEEEIYLSSPEKLEEYIKSNGLDSIFVGSNKESLDKPLRFVYYQSPASETDYLEIQRAIQKHLAIGIYLKQCAGLTKDAFGLYRKTLRHQLQQIAPHLVKADIDVEDTRTQKVLKFIDEEVGMPITMAMYNTVLESYQQFKQEVLNSDNKQPPQQQGQETEHKMDAPITIDDPKALQLKNRLDDVERYIGMVDVVLRSTNEDLRDLFEGYTCPTFVVQSSTQDYELLQALATSYTTINSTKMVLKLLNFWLLYQQTSDLFPYLVPFDILLKKWDEFKPMQIEYGRLRDEEAKRNQNIAEQKQQDEQQRRQQQHNQQDSNNTTLLSLQHRSNRRLNDDIDDFDAILQDESAQLQHHQQFDDKFADQLEKLLPQTKSKLEDDDTPPDFSSPSSLFDNLIKNPGQILAQPPPIYRLPLLIHPPQMMKFISEIFSTADMLGGAGSTSLQVPIPIVKVAFDTLTLSQEELSNHFTPPKPGDVIDLSQFLPQDQIFQPKEVDFDQFTNSLGTLLNPDGGQFDFSKDFSAQVIKSFISDVQKSGLPLNTEYAEVNRLDLATYFHNNTYTDSTPIPRLDTTTGPAVGILKPFYSKQQKMIKQDEKMARRRQKRLKKLEKQRQKEQKRHKSHEIEEIDPATQEKMLLYGSSHYIGTSGMIGPSDPLDELLTRQQFQKQSGLLRQQTTHPEPIPQLTDQKDNALNLHSAQPKLDMDYLTASIENEDDEHDFDDEYEPDDAHEKELV